MIKKAKVIVCLYAGIVAASAMEDYDDLYQREDESQKEVDLYKDMENMNGQKQEPSTIGTIKNADNKIPQGQANQISAILKKDDNKVAQEGANQIPAPAMVECADNKIVNNLNFG